MDGTSASNPFRSERLRPGVVPFLFGDGQSMDDVLEQLQRSHWRGEIVGPHGTGKSTLVQELLPLIASDGHPVVFGSFSGGRQQWNELPAAAGASDRAEKKPQRVIVIDGFEQLSAFARWKCKWLTYWLGWGLVVTTHRSVGLPVLVRTNVSSQLAQEIARRIAGDDFGGLNQSDVESALAEHQGNMRDALFWLYDQIEARRGNAGE